MNFSKYLQWFFISLIVFILISCGGENDTKAKDIIIDEEKPIVNDIIENVAIKSLISQIDLSPVYKNPSNLRVLYLIPSDKQENTEYTTALKNTFSSIQDWYLKNMDNNKTFSFLKPKLIVETVHSSHPESWFYLNSADTNTWAIFSNTIRDMETILGTKAQNETWVIYVDANRQVWQCDSRTVNGQNGGGGILGLTVMHGDDLNGLTQKFDEIICTTAPIYDNNLYRWVGGSAHEVGHAFGLPHPTDVGRVCDKQSCLMEGMGYTLYPDTDLTEVGKSILDKNPIFSTLPVINSIFDNLEQDYKFTSQETRLYDHNNSYLYYRRYNNNFLIEQNGTIYAVINGSMENKGKLKSWFNVNHTLH